MFAQQTDQDINYQKELVELESFEATVRAFIDHGGMGANVTVPFKERAFAMCDELSERAKFSEAVNTLAFSNGKIFGDNTDGVGLVKDLHRNGVTIKAKKVLLLGAGGAAKGVIPSLLEENPQQLVIVNRTHEKALALASKYNLTQLTAMKLNELENYQADIIINATSSGLSGQSLPIPRELFKTADVCYDMVYGKELPIFLRQAKQHGVNKIIDGLGMLVYQAAAAFQIWRGAEPEAELVIQRLRLELNQ